MRIVQPIATFVIACSLASCGEKPPNTYEHTGSMKFTIDVPAALKAKPESSDGVWTSVEIVHEDRDRRCRAGGE